MNSNLLFDFTVQKENKTILIKREFAADLNLVWDAWTKPELLDQWWAPKPYQNQTISMNFTVGGVWFYAMISPKDQKHYCKAYYKSIETLKSFSYRDAFCNEKGEDLSGMPSTLWHNTFISQNKDLTIVNMVLTYDSEEALENIIKMGFKEGFSIGLNQLDALLNNLKKIIY